MRIDQAQPIVKMALLRVPVGLPVMNGSVWKMDQRKESMDVSVFTKVWLVRLAISLFATAVVAWGVSFIVADYVVRANTSSMERSIEAVLQANGATAAGADASAKGILTALEMINATLKETNRAVGGLRDETTFLVGLQKDSAGEIARLRTDLDSLRAKIEQAGIDVNFDIKSLFAPSNEMWSTIRAEYGISDEEPVFLKIEPYK